MAPTRVHAGGDSVPELAARNAANLAAALESTNESKSIFRSADQKQLPIVDLSDLRALLTVLSSDQEKAELTGIGGLATATVAVLLRSLVGLEDGGGNELFGEPQFQISDLLRTHRTAAA